VAASRTTALEPARTHLRWVLFSAGPRRMAVARLMLLLVLLAVWQFGAPLLRIPSFLLPTPTAVASALVQQLTASPLSSESLYFHAAVTLTEGLTGFFLGGLVGLLLGTILAHSSFLERMVLPYIMGFESVPKVAVAPLIVIWFGIGMTSKIVLVFLLSFFPLLINSLVGFKSVDSERIELLTSLKASRWQIFRLVRIRSALPAIFAGIELAILFSLTGSIVGEFLAGQAGLGVLIQRTQRDFNLAGTFATLIFLAVVGVLLMGITRMIHRRVLFWAPSELSDTNI
jgi:NitT/TauT family transport system permease protein